MYFRELPRILQQSCFYLEFALGSPMAAARNAPASAAVTSPSSLSKPIVCSDAFAIGPPSVRVASLILRLTVSAATGNPPPVGTPAIPPGIPYHGCQTSLSASAAASIAVAMAAPSA